MDQNSQQAAAGLIAGMMGFFFIFALVIMALVILPCWRIATKAGLPGPIALLALIPGIGMLVTLYVLAFMEWKVVPAVAAYPTGLPAYPPPPPSPPATYTQVP